MLMLERSVRIREVKGSNPSRSTKSKQSELFSRGRKVRIFLFPGDVPTDSERRRIREIEPAGLSFNRGALLVYSASGAPPKTLSLTILKQNSNLRETFPAYNEF